MSNITEYAIYKKDTFYQEVKKHVPHAQKEDTDRILLAYGLELKDGNVMILVSENHKEDLSPSFQLTETLNKFYNLSEEDHIIIPANDYIWPWRDNSFIINDLLKGKNKNLIDREYLKDD